MLKPAACALLLCFGLAAASAASLRELAPNAVLLESFDSLDNWVHSSADKYTGRFELTDDAEDPELRIPERAKHYGLTALLASPLDPSKGLVVQYEATFPGGYNCGGSYVKLLTHTPGFKPEDLVDSTPYTIMFGPDKCGDPTGKIHMILRHRSPASGEVTEKHLQPHPTPTLDNLAHVYTLIIQPDNTFEVLVDGEVKSSGSLFDSLEPSINPPREIPDPEDVKPEDWADEAQIPDPDAKQPEDWDMRPEIPHPTKTKPKGWLDDEPLEIPDPAAKRPADWDDEEDGEWEAPIIRNPKCKRVGCGEWRKPVIKNPAYKGPWKAPMVDNPDYKGPWVQRQIPNPEFFEDDAPLKHIGKIGALAFEIWTIDEGYQFDNVYVGRDPEEAEALRNEVWRPKLAAKKKAFDNQAKAETKSKSGNDGPKDFTKDLAEIVTQFLLSEKLSLLRPTFIPVIKAMERTPESVYGLLAAPLIVVVTLAFAIPNMRSQKKARLAASRTAAAAGSDTKDGEKEDEEEEKEEKEEEEEVKEEEAKQTVAAEQQEPTEEIMADDDDEDKGAVRRRARRA